MAVGLDHRRYRRLRSEFRDECEAAGAPCWLCREDIDYELPSGHPDSWSLDHAHPRKTHPELIDDPENFRASHLECNRRRRETEPDAGLGIPSRQWVRA